MSQAVLAQEYKLQYRVRTRRPRRQPAHGRAATSLSGRTSFPSRPPRRRIRGSGGSRLLPPCHVYASLETPGLQPDSARPPGGIGAAGNFPGHLTSAMMRDCALTRVRSYSCGAYSLELKKRHSGGRPGLRGVGIAANLLARPAHSPTARNPQPPRRLVTGGGRRAAGSAP